MKYGYDDVQTLYNYMRIGRCTHVNDDKIFGVAFDLDDGGRVFVYSRPYGGLWVEDELSGENMQILGTCQFNGRNSESVRRFLK